MLGRLSKSRRTVAGEKGYDTEPTDVSDVR